MPRTEHLRGTTDDVGRSRAPDGVLLVSCYELGHQPLGVASAAGFLERAGFRPRLLDLAVQPLDSVNPDRLRSIWFVGVSVPMHTALRLGMRAARRLRGLCPDAHICLYGLYGLLNADHLLGTFADSVIGGEVEGPLTDLVHRVGSGGEPAGVPGVVVTGGSPDPHLARLSFSPPAREGLPGLSRYAGLEHRGEIRLAAAVETSRGCLHHCRHCPIPPVYDGRFFVVPQDIVLEDIRHVAACGATHVTFSDPDFLNGPQHAVAMVQAMHREIPGLTFDFTAKIEHILKWRSLLPEFADSGCLFVVSAVESLDDTVLGILDKGHDARDVFESNRLLTASGIALRPSLMPFTPWETLESYGAILDWIERDDLVYHVDPVQLSIRLLVPPGSILANHPAMRPHLGKLSPGELRIAWSHPDPRMDDLHREVERGVRQGASTGEDPAATFAGIRAIHARVTGECGDRPTVCDPPGPRRSRPPRLTEPWFC